MPQITQMGRVILVAGESSGEARGKAQGERSRETPHDMCITQRWRPTCVSGCGYPCGSKVTRASHSPPTVWCHGLCPARST